jgi:hypothetical protein
LHFSESWGGRFVVSDGEGYIHRFHRFAQI